MTIDVDLLYGLGIVFGTILVAFVVGETSYIFQNRQTNEAFITGMDTMTKASIQINQQVANTAVTAINSIEAMSALKDVNHLAEKKVDSQTATVVKQ